MPNFKLKQTYKPTGDQPQAIEKLASLVNSGSRHQTLLGVTGSGKTFTIANVIQKTQRPALVISHNKTLAAQLYQEFKNFFPENAVHYFVSYYDYYQPEAYIPQTDTYIEKDAKINEFIDSMRHAATASALTRNDLIIVASVSCIYGIGDPEEYERASLEIKTGMETPQKTVLKKLVELQYERGDFALLPGTFRARGEVVEIASPSGGEMIKIEWSGNTIEKVEGAVRIFPAKHFVIPQQKLKIALANIELELKDRVNKLKKQNKLLEAERLTQRTKYDLKMIRETGYTHGIENYSRHLSFRKEGEPPFTLLDFMPENFLIFMDESHATVPQLRGMYAGDRARKQVLVDYGFRLSSAIDNRPLTFEEFNRKVGQIIYVSATPAEYELEKSHQEEKGVVEQLIRPTGLLDPKIEFRKTSPSQPGGKIMEEVVDEIKKRSIKNQRVLVTTLTKRTAEDLSEYLKEAGVKAEYLHSDIKTLERPKILRELRSGKYDAVVGVNLLREGLDLPEVSLVIILDADKEGFLRNYQTLIQTMGRAARHTQGKVIMYGDTLTASMKKAMDESGRRRKKQEEYNQSRGITPAPLKKEISDSIFGILEKEKAKKGYALDPKLKSLPKAKLKESLAKEMLLAAEKLDFERAAELRDLIKNLK